MSDTYPDPAAGGRYVRNADGSLKQIHKTESAAGGLTRDPGDAAAAQVDAPAATPAAAPAAGKKE
jgi:hypothetical protein